MENEKESKGKTNSEDDSGEGDKLPAVEVLKQQSARIKELEDDILAREEEKARAQLGGTTHGGSAPKDKVIESALEYSKRVLAGDLNKKDE